MADAAVTFLLENVTQLLKSYVHLIAGAENELEQLKKDLQLLKANLKQAEDVANKDEKFTAFERQIREVVFDAEDTIDTCLITLRLGPVARRARHFLPIRHRSLLRTFNLANEVKSVRENKVKPILEKALRYFTTMEEESLRRVGESWTAVKKVQLIREDNVVGFEDEEETIINYLKEEKEKLDVISITGMPGLGKTTLAWKVFNSNIIRDEFPVRIWVYVSQDFNERDVFQHILKDFTKQDMSSLSEHRLVQTVRAYLFNHKFLLVMDDVWTTEAWDAIQCVLPKNNKMGKVLITSRDQQVGKYANVTREPHMLRFLEDHESWELLQLEVFGKVDDCPQELQEIGKVIAKQCNGLPLSLVVIGGVLAEQYSPTRPTDAINSAWKKVSENVSVHRRDMHSRAIDIVALNYQNLPRKLRDCFLYLGVFPEDYEIPVQTLTRLWIAEGFVQLKEGGQSLEETAEENLKGGQSLEETAEENLKGGQSLKETAEEKLKGGQSLEETAEENLKGGQSFDETAEDNLKGGQGLKETAEEKLKGGQSLEETAEENLKGGQSFDETAEDNLKGGQGLEEIAEDNLKGGQRLEETAEENSKGGQSLEETAEENIKGGQSLEEIALENLKDLINMNLVMVGKTSPTGEVKTCRVHDVIHEFCKSKASARDQNLLLQIQKSRGVFQPSASVIRRCRRLCIHSHVNDFLQELQIERLKAPLVRSFLCFCKDPYVCINPKHLSTIPDAFKLLRVLDSKATKFNQFPPNITRLIHLRYITLSVDNLSILPEEVSELWNLQTLVVDTKSRVLEIKANIWTMIQLRHLKTKAEIILATRGEGQGQGGENLQTLSRLSPKNCTQDVLQRACNLKRLGIRGDLAILLENATSFQNLDSVETLKLKHDDLPYQSLSESPLLSLPPHNNFPPNIKRLTLSATFLDWHHMSTLAMIRTLEVLKLKDNAFMGMSWNAVGAGFPCLQFLLIESSDLVFWEASNDHFPSLWCLVIKNCEKLSTIPVGLARSLQMLEMEHVPRSAVESAKKIKEDKEQMQARKGGFKLEIGPGCDI